MNKKPRIFEETKEYIEFEVPEGKAQEYDLPDGCFLSGNGEDLKKNYYEYYTKLKGDRT